LVTKDGLAEKTTSCRGRRLMRRRNSERDGGEMRSSHSRGPGLTRATIGGRSTQGKRKGTAKQDFKKGQ